MPSRFSNIFTIGEVTLFLFVKSFMLHWGLPLMSNGRTLTAQVPALGVSQPELAGSQQGEPVRHAAMDKACFTPRTCGPQVA